MTNVILCGGNGTRLWPISRTLMPKQFVKLFNDKSLFQLTVERNSKVCDSQFIVSNTEQYFLAVDQLEELHKNNSKYLLEPVGKNTAPAIALACFALDPEELVLVTPSDHLIKDEEEYKKALQSTKELAEQDNIVTFGITPTIVNLTQALSEEWNVFNIAVNCIVPERTLTPMRIKNFGYEDRKTLLDSIEVAKVSLHVLINSSTNGQIIDIKVDNV